MSLAGIGFDSKRDFAPLLSCWGFSFALGHGVSFFGGIQHSPVDDCSVASCNFGVLTGEDEHMSFYFAILKAKPHLFIHTHTYIYMLLLLSRFSRVRLCDPIDSSPQGSSVPGILQARTLERVPFPSPMHESEK